MLPCIRSVMTLVTLLSALAMTATETDGRQMLASSGSEDAIKTLFRPIDAEARDCATGCSLGDKTSEDVAAHLVEKYEREMDLIIDGLETAVGVTLSEDERCVFKLLVIEEHLNRLYMEALKDSYVADDEAVSIKPVRLEDGGDAINGTEGSLCFVQVQADVYGDSGIDDAGHPYDVDGENSLFLVKLWPRPGYSYYELWFRDEDHPDPAVDALYDRYRMIEYGRLEDVEGFLLNGQAVFDHIWDANKTYGSPAGSHGDMARDRCNVVYVSNVWNHAADVYDKNPAMEKVWWRVS